MPNLKAFIDATRQLAKGLWRSVTVNWTKRRAEIDRIYGLPPLWISSTTNGVTAICLASDFNKAIETYMEELLQGKHDPLSLISVRVVPTFTFWKEEKYLRPIHTGNERDFLALQAEMEEMNPVHIFGDHDDFNCRKVTKEDGRLFVPYCSPTSSTKEMLEVYGKQTLDNAKKYLLFKV